MLGLPEEVRMKAKPRHFTRKGQAVVVAVLKALKDSDPLWAEAHVESYALKDSDPLGLDRVWKRMR
jgi:hypothetical protein